MLMFIAIISIFGITAMAFLLNRRLPFKICPICAGVAGTWLWMLGAQFLGYKIDLTILAILMGGSVVGMAYQIEKRWRTKRRFLLWKTLFIVTGFAAVYGFVSQKFAVLFVSLAVLAFLLFVIFLARTNRSPSTQGVKELEKKMEECC